MTGRGPDDDELRKRVRSGLRRIRDDFTEAHDLRSAGLFPHLDRRGVELGAMSAREKEVLGAVSHGLSNGEIGVLFFISEETVKSHMRRIHRKLAAKNRTHAVAVAIRERLIP